MGICKLTLVKKNDIIDKKEFSMRINKIELLYLKDAEIQQFNIRRSNECYAFDVNIRFSIGMNSNQF